MNRRSRVVAVKKAPVSAPAKFAREDGVACLGLTEVAAPWGFDPRILNTDSEVDRMVLALALACNDIQSAGWAIEVLDRGRGAVDRVDGYDGCRVGIALWVTRMLAGTLNEILEAVEMHHRLLTTHPDATATLDEMTEAGVTGWRRLLALSTARHSHPERAFLLQARSNLAFHYYQPDPLAAGYRRVFTEAPKGEYNSFAYVSFGQRFKHHRFYFADAAVQDAANALGDAKLSESGGKLQTLVNELGTAAFSFVRAFVQMRAMRLQQAERGAR